MAISVLNEVLSLNAQEFPLIIPNMAVLGLLNEVLSLNAQESDRDIMAAGGWILNEVLSLNAQESHVSQAAGQYSLPQ